jgi:hypothetical protein
MSYDVMEKEGKIDALDKFAKASNAAPDALPSVRELSGVAERVIGAQQVAVYRDEARILTKLKALAAAAGTDWYYRFPVQNRRENRTDWIEGPSIKLANDLARMYGNCEVDIRTLDLGDSWLFYARFTDFETGFSLTRPFQQYKGASKMGNDDARKKDIAFQIGASKAIRNVVVNALQTYADFAFEEAKNALVERIGKNLDGWRVKIADRIKDLGIDVKRVEAVMGRVAVDWLAPDMSRIIAMMKSINDGMATLDETFPPLEAAKAEPAAKASQLDGFAKADQQTAQQAAPGASGEASKPKELITVEEARLRARDAAMQGLDVEAMPDEIKASPALADAWRASHKQASEEAEL